MYGRIQTVKVSRKRSILKSIYISGGTSGKSYKNTSKSSFMTKTISRVGLSEFESLTEQDIL